MQIVTIDEEEREHSKATTSLIISDGDIMLNQSVYLDGWCIAQDEITLKHQTGRNLLTILQRFYEQLDQLYASVESA